MTDEQLKETLESKKEDIRNAFINKATYDKWDKHSPIWVYDILEDTIEKITDMKIITYILIFRNYYVSCFLNKKDAKTYKWLHNFIEKEVGNRILEGTYTDNFVSFKDLNIGDQNVFYVKE